MIWTVEQRLMGYWNANRKVQTEKLWNIWLYMQPYQYSHQIYQKYAKELSMIWSYTALRRQLVIFY